MSEKYPNNMLAFFDTFTSDQDCLEYLTQLRWPEGIYCPVCHVPVTWKHPTRCIWRCSRCKKDISPTANTVLHGNKIGLRKLFCIAWELVDGKQGVSAQKLARDLGLWYKVAWTWLHKLRQILVLWNRTPLSWSVEVDEVFVWGKQAGKRWRGAFGKEIVVIAVEKNTNIPVKNGKNAGQYRGMWRVRMSVIPNCWTKTLALFITDNIETGSILYTDGLKSYLPLEKQGYQHIVEQKGILSPEILWVNHDEVTPNVHLVASLLKRWLLGTHQNYLAGWGYLQYYLDEYTFRYNRRTSSERWKLFLTLMKQIVTMPPTSFHEIQKKRHKKEKKVIGTK